MLVMFSSVISRPFATSLLKIVAGLSLP
jgi:hypothetical protein